MRGRGAVLSCQAMLFDMDGVLVDSMAVIERILRAWATEHGLDADAAVALSHGRRDVDIVRLVAPHLDAEVEVRNLVAREERDFTGVAEVPGAADLLAVLPSEAWAIVTSATTAVAQGRLNAAGLPAPRRLVCAEDVTKGKPDPEGYLRAAQLLNATPARCVVVEDAPGGADAARAAGMRCIGVGSEVGHGVNPPAHQVDDLRQIRARVVPGGLQVEIL